MIHKLSSIILVRCIARVGNGFGKFNSSENHIPNHPPCTNYRPAACVSPIFMSSATRNLFQLSVIFLHGTSTPEPCWTMVGVGIRYAQDIGIHLRKRHQKPSVENELWKRAFWMLVCMDTISCSFLGRPRATSSDEYVYSPMLIESLKNDTALTSIFPILAMTSTGRILIRN